MENIKIVKNHDGIDQVVIEHTDNSYTSMAKSVYDELEAAKEKQSGTL